MPNTRTHAPRGALVFDTRLLGRGAGSALTQKRTVPAPADLRLELIGVPEGADVALEVRFEAVTEGVLATGTATAPLAGECARCLAPVTSSVTASFQELYLYADGRARTTRAAARTTSTKSMTGMKSTTGTTGMTSTTSTRSRTTTSGISTATCSTWSRLSVTR